MAQPTLLGGGGLGRPLVRRGGRKWGEGSTEGDPDTAANVFAGENCGRNGPKGMVNHYLAILPHFVGSPPPKNNSFHSLPGQSPRGGGALFHIQGEMVRHTKKNSIRQM